MHIDRIPVYRVYQRAIDLELYHAFAELVVQTSQDDTAGRTYRQTRAMQIWQVHIFSGRPPQFLEECSPLISHKHIVRLDRTGISQRQGQSAENSDIIAQFFLKPLQHLARITQMIWFIRFYAEQAKKYRGKADLVLRTLMKLPYMNMKPDSREFSVLWGSNHIEPLPRVPEILRT